MKHVRIEDNLYKELRSMSFKNEMSITRYINELLKQSLLLKVKVKSTDDCEVVKEKEL